MRVQFVNLDSNGEPVTQELTVTVDGERHTVEPAATGSANVPEAVGSYLVDQGIARDYEEYHSVSEAAEEDAEDEAGGESDGE